MTQDMIKTIRTIKMMNNGKSAQREPSLLCTSNEAQTVRLGRTTTQARADHQSGWGGLWRSALLLLMMMTVGVGDVWADDVPFEVTTNPSTPHYYLLQNVGTTSFYAMPYDDINVAEVRITTTNVPNSDMRFYFMSVENEDDYYYIIHCSGKYLYAKGAANADGGAILKALSTTDIDRYKFSIVKDGGGYYILNKSLGDSAPLCKRGGNTGIGYKDNKNKDYYFLKWNTWKDNSGNRDDFFRWIFVQIGDTNPITWTATFTPSSEGNYHYYKIKNSVNTSFYISGNTSTNVNTSSTAGSDDEITWIFEEVPAGENGSDNYITYYYIIHAFTGEYMCFDGEPSNYNQNQENALILQPKTETNEQKCQFIVTRSSQRNVTTHYNIIPKVLKDYYWDYQCVGQKDNTGRTNVWTATDRDGDANTARWIFEQATGYPAPCADPVISCDANGTVSMTSEEGASIYYLMEDGLTTPEDDPSSESGDLYSDAEQPRVTSTKTIKAIAIKGPHVSSVVTQTIVYVPNQTFDTETYDGTAKAPVVKVGDTTISADKYYISYKKDGVAVEECKDAGTYTVEITDKEDGDYIVYGSGSFTIDKATPEVTAPTANSLIYSGAAQELITAGTTTGGTIQYALSEGGTSSSDIPTGTAAGAYTVYYKVVGNDNYNDVDEAGPVNVTISPKTVKDDPDTSAGESEVSVVLSDIPEGGYTYDGTAKTPTVTVKDGESVISAEEYTVAITDNVNSGTNTATVTITDKDGGNYIVSGTTTFSINKATLTVTANNKSITYGDEPANAGVSYTGFVEGEDENTEGMFSGTLGYVYNSAADGSEDAYTTTSNVGSYFIIPSGLTAANYDITFENGTLTVDQKEVGIEWSNISLPYNGLEQKPTATATGLVNNDEIGVTVTTDREAIAIADDYTATADGLTGDKAGNYKLPTPKPERSFKITKAVLTITAKPHTITYGDEPNNDGVTYESSIVNDNVDGIEFTGELDYDYTYERYGDVSDAEHTYTITPKGLTSTNYSITYNAGTLTVEPKEVGLTWSSPTTFTYNGREQAPTANATGMVNGDEIGVTVTGGKTNASTESYTATASALTGTKAGNYKLPDDATQTFSIAKAPLTATADDVNIIYGDEAPTAYTISYTGFVNDEDENAITTAPTAACTYTQGNDAGDYDITVSDDGVADNYEITPVNGKLTVNPKVVKDNPDVDAREAAITIELSDIPEGGFIYDGSEKTPTVTVKDGDTVIPGGENGEYTLEYTNNKNAGTNTATVTITDKNGGNYNVSGSTTFSIAPKSIGNGTTSAEGFVISFDDSENVTITCPIETLTKDTDFTVDGPTEEDGIQMWTIAGIGNYSGGAKVMRIVLYFYDTGADTGENVQDVGTFQASSDMVISGKDVYIVTDVNLTKNQVVLSKIAYAPKDVPVLLLTDLEGDDTETTTNAAAFPIEVAEGDEADTSGNILKRVEAGGLQVTFAKVFMFYIGKFVLTTEGTLETGTYYFDNPNPPSSSVAGARLSIVIDETTDIDGIKEYDNTGTVIDRWYSLDGCRLNGKPTRKGLYIKNGQKVVIK